ncbi:ImmA/IrrE family metallo-endopeptidase [Thalassoglobus sp.]|uniref:ImmA/IrrE family metallo-endopeptidase n=1 Tax=Thalassoglobus sp. TaxID=2795869 RepID=UPI003AA93124
MSNLRKDIAYIEGDKIPACNLNKSQVEAYAETVASQANFQVGSDPADLVKRLRGRIHLQDTDKWEETATGSIFVHGRFDFDICLPKYTSTLRDRFTVAHELGHYFLHSNQGEQAIIAYRSGSTRIEWEANWFAAAFLMPKTLFTKAMKENKSIVSIATQFGVSQEAAKVRSEVLGD